MGNAGWQRSFPEKQESPAAPTSGELETARLSSAVRWTREYAIRPPTEFGLRSLEMLLSAPISALLKAEIEGQVVAARRRLDPFNAP